MGIFGPPDVYKLEAKRDVKGVIKALSYKKEYYVRRYAAAALGRIGDQRAIEPLISALQDENWDVRMCAAEALGKIGAPKAVEPLISTLQDENSDVRERAAEALVNIGKPAVEPLTFSLRDKHSAVRRDAARALHKIGWKPDTNESKIIYYVASGNWDACVKMGAIAIEPLISALQDENGSVRAHAAEALGKIGAPKAVEPLTFSLRDNSGEVRMHAAEALGKIGDPKAVEPLTSALQISALRDEYDNVLMYFTEALGRIGDHKAVESLISALRDENNKLRRHAARALHNIGWKPDTNENKIIYYIVSGNWDACIKMGAIAVEPLISALHDENWDVRMHAAEALGKLGDPQAVDPLVVALKDKDRRVYCAAAEALATLYHNDKLDTISKKRILSLRDYVMACSHYDVSPPSDCHADVGNKQLRF